MGFISISWPGREKLVAPMTARAKAPFTGEVGKAVVQSMRSGGSGAIDRQIARWPKGKAFGSYQPSGGGSVARAWMGRAAGSITTIEPTRVRVGVDPTVHPQIVEWQRRKPKPRRPISEAQRIYVGVKFGAWMRKGHRITAPARLVTVTRPMIDRVYGIVFHYIATGEVGSGSA